MNSKDLKSFLKENKSFSKLWTSQILSSVTINIINFVMATRIYEKTGSTLAVSFLWIFYYLPSFFLGPFSGFFVDIWPLKKTLLITNILQAVIVFFFIFIGGKIYPIYPLVFLFSLVNQFYYPAEAASLPWLVKKKSLPMANSLFLLTAQTALIFGFGVSGILMQLFGGNNPVILSVVFLLIATISVYRIPGEQINTKIHKINLLKFFTQIKIGYTFIQKNRIVLFPILLATIFQIMLVVLAVALPSFATELIKIKIAAAGPILIVPLGLGAFAGTYILSNYFEGVRKKILIKKGLLGVFFVFMLLALILPFLGLFKVIAAAILMFLFGISIVFVFVPSQTLIQEKTPQIIRGRVFGAWNFISTVATLPVLLFSATIVDLLGVGLFTFLGGILIFILYLSFDRVERMIETSAIKVEVAI